MKVAVIGLGSMGKRRIRNLRALGHTAEIGYDPRADRCLEAREKYGIDAQTDWNRVRNARVDAWIISTPPDLHIDYAFEAIERSIPFFTEANVPDVRTPELIRRLSGSGIVGVPSCTMRYYPGPRTISKLVREGAIGQPLGFTYHSGQYLPDWHPWEDIRDFYVSQRATGGAREIVPFELEWLVALFGGVNGVAALKGKVSDLPADIDDVYQILLRFDRGVLGHLLVDAVARPAVRYFRLLGTDGTLEWDNKTSSIRVFRVGDGTWTEMPLQSGTVEPGYVNAEEPYIAELRDFMAAVHGEDSFPYSFAQDEYVHRVLLRAECSAAEEVSR